MSDFDVLIVGGGIAGASLGAKAARVRRTAIIEAESHCGYHATGRSAAFWLESYGGPHVAVLSAASHDFLMRPPEDFSERGFLRTRGAIHLARDAFPELPAGVESRVIERGELEQLVPGIRPDWRRALLEPGCADIDVAALHAAYLRRFRQSGGTVAADSQMISASWFDGRWTVHLKDGSTLRAAIFVNAAGAWADQVAEAAGVEPLAISPKRRTMVQLRVGRSGLRDLPLVDDAAGTFYFKGEGDRSIWLTPHDEIDSDPCDAAPDEIDVATAVARFEDVVDWPVEAVERTWAGLRSFSRDRVPVYGFDRDVPSFFWCVGQGGFGIQTAPAASDLAASLLLGEPSRLEVDPAPYAASRFR
ncbi:FAD-binding oxidoreductase [Sphingomonas sp. SM33]|uniref:FAD-binding oxidoreductase n=1 Tax=Sphingomonas telluris TaxID=2907998 RepID=A0ABS9VKZ5_9SPHN|nr:FAD-binding oxidoreductase [Sphingomonas telluris]MCH8615092.1 FAD-binding oxidoreductase [Sphingomonas telluris]